MKLKASMLACVMVPGLLVGGGAVVQAAPMIELQQLATFDGDPIGIANAGDGSGRLFIILQDGRIMIYSGGGVLPDPFLDISDRVSCCGERGLLGLAFHPDYAQNGQFYVNYTDVNGDTHVSRFLVTNDPDVADPDSEKPVIAIDQPFSNHNGGQLQFGPDGYLYIGMGDGGSGGDPGNRAQDLGELLGKMLRIDVDNGNRYAIPPTNPFIDVPGARPEIWAYGFRNPWRFGFDRATGDLFIADVGQEDWEEISFQRASSPGGENYGWRLMEGKSCYNPPENCNDGSLKLPIIVYPHSHDGDFIGCAVIGGYRYRGPSYPALTGVYFFADNCTGRLWAAIRQGPAAKVREIAVTGLNITSFGEDEAGDHYLTEIGDNALYKLIDAQARDGVTNASPTP
jgi:glucose/arabinose dehydrogenase